MERSVFQVAIVFCILATQVVAFAQPCARAFPTTTGQKTKCAGILIPTVQANRALACMRFDLPQCFERMDVSKRLCDVDKSALSALLKAERANFKLPVTVVSESGWLGEAVAFGLGLAVSALAAYAWSEARD